MKRIALILASALLLVSCSQSATESVDEAATPVEFFFVSDTPRGFKLFSEIQFITGTEDPNLQILSDLVSGSVVPLDPQYVNLWGNGNTVNSVSINGSAATVDLGTLQLNLGAEGERRAIDQLVWTLTAFIPEVKSLSFTVDGETVESFAGHVDTTQTFERALAYEVLNPLQITSMNEGASLTSPVMISGQACTFEANVVWELSRDGAVVDKGFTSATIGCPDRGDWSISFEDLEPGDYVISVLEYSAEDGSLFAKDDKNFTVN